MGFGKAEVCTKREGAVMAKSIIDSVIYRSGWTHPLADALFDEKKKIATWLKIIRVLAISQGQVGLIPSKAANEIARKVNHLSLNYRRISSDYAKTGHSLLPILRQVEKVLTPAGREYLCYGVTVQDITDTWLIMTCQLVLNELKKDLARAGRILCGLAKRHSGTPMLGRTHGQPGLVISFGFKAASWLSEVQQHLDILEELKPRLFVGQLCGGAGALSSFGEKGFDLQKVFFEKLELTPPLISWTSSRIALVEFAHCMSRVSATFDRIGRQVYLLQHPEIGELCESSRVGQVHSITMPQKINPELSEHLGTLAKGILCLSHGVSESLVHDHERDGRSWKTEWYFYPDLMTLALTQASKGVDLLRKINVSPKRMRRNIDLQNGYCFSEALIYSCAQRVGLKKAKAIVGDLITTCRKKNLNLFAAAKVDQKILRLLNDSDFLRIESFYPNLINCTKMTDQVVAMFELKLNKSKG
jgi:adenylosuccinate lyase